jgi:segregation and condensation protein B
MSDIILKHILEAALLAAARPLALDDLARLFPETDVPDPNVLRAALDELAADYTGRGIELIEVASGFRIQVRQEMERWVSRLWEEKPPKYSRALLETLALIAYRQPITRGEIEDIRGVTVSTSIMKTLQEREWIRVVAHRDVPGRPAMYGTTREFLDYFNLKSLEDLPSLAELRDIDSINAELDFGPLEGGRLQASAAFGDPTDIDIVAAPDDTDFVPVEVDLERIRAAETLH